MQKLDYLESEISKSKTPAQKKELEAEKAMLSQKIQKNRWQELVEHYKIYKSCIEEAYARAKSNLRGDHL